MVDNYRLTITHFVWQKASFFLCDAALRIGAAQILFLDTPSYAAIMETVEVLRMHPQIKVE